MNRFSLLIMSCFLFSCFASAQTTLDGPGELTYFEGTVKYEINLKGKVANDFILNKAPEKMDVHIGPGSFIVQLYQSRIPKTFLFVSDSNHTYIVDAREKKYYLKDYFVDTSKYVPKVVLTDKTEIVNGYECKVYRAKRGNSYIFYYVNDNFFVDESLYEGKDGAKADFLIPGLRGFIPLKKVTKQPHLTSTIEISSIKRKEFDKSLFSIPEDFEKGIRFNKK